MQTYNLEKEKYIELLNSALYPLYMFDSLDYAVDVQTGAEYLRLNDSVGTGHFLEVTGLDLEGLLIDVLQVCAGKIPATLVQDLSQKRKLTALFKR